jgi:serine/threonine protein kinase
MAPEPMFAGPYLLGQTLGKGTTGKVKVGSHRQHHLPVAIKIISKSNLEANPDAKHRVEREISILKLLKHPNIMSIYDIMQTQTHIFIVLEHLGGGELYDYVLQRGFLPADEVFLSFHQMLMGVEYMHTMNICHRDLKLENLLLDTMGNIKLADFGMASTMPPDGMLHTSCGSPHYACPEIVRGEAYHGVQADLWSMGVILFALATGTLPFDDDSVPALFDKIKAASFRYPRALDPGLEAIIGGLLTVASPDRLDTEAILRSDWYADGEKRLPAAMVAQKQQHDATVAALRAAKTADSVPSPTRNQTPHSAAAATPSRTSIKV